MSLGSLLVSIAVAFLLLNGLSAAAIWGIREALIAYLGYSPFALNGTEILLASVLFAIILKQLAEEAWQDEKARRAASKQG